MSTFTEKYQNELIQKASARLINTMSFMIKIMCILLLNFCEDYKKYLELM